MAAKIKHNSLAIFSKLEIPVAAFLVTFIMITLMPAQQSFASELVNPLTASPQTSSFRDINDLNPTPSPIISLDKTTYRIGQTAQLTINDPNANVDLSRKDNITATVSSNQVHLTETDINTGIFVGSFTVTSNVNVNYVPDSPYAPRATVTLDTNAIGNVHVSDVALDTIAAASLPFKAITQPINLTLSGGAVLSGTNVIVQMSMANALLDPNDDLTNAVMYYKPASPPGAGWIKVSVEGDTSTGGDVDFNTFTITNNPAHYVPPAIITGEGQYILAFDTGGQGGGSTGLVSAGFVLNFVAGLSVSNSAPAPPSFGGGGGGHQLYSDGLTLTQGTEKTIFDTAKYNQEIPTQVMVTGKKVNMDFKTFESYNPTGMVHMALYVIPRGQDMLTSNSIASIVWEKNSPVIVNDPDHILSDASASSSLDGKYQHTQFSFVPTKSYDKMSFLARAWNDHRQSADIRVHDAVVPPPATKTLPAGVIKYDNFDNLQTALEKDRFYKPQVMAHIHSTYDVFSSSENGQVYWLYDTINHSVTLIIADKDDNELGSVKGLLEQYSTEQRGDYGFMHFTVQQLNRWNEDQEKNIMELEEAKAMSLALEKGLILHSNW